MVSGDMYETILRMCGGVFFLFPGPMLEPTVRGECRAM